MVRLVVWALPDDLEQLRWVGAPFAAAVVASLGVLVLAARWRPGRV